MKWVLILFCIAEVLSAIVQFNDPDPWLWVPIYLIPCILTAFYFGNKLPKYLKIGVLVLYLSGLFTYFPSLIGWAQDGFPTITGSMKAESKYIELVREGGGLLICIVHLILLLYPGKMKK
ncbi:transmembrane 220 family protein [Membranihabitans maritimus]|uniref:transmembrane 220 family protein n=1 Tax=Membranihabitans maritimus TaxID=2904244 RepID=UPI001F31F320|nr:transmembrane 220 family protein [Membranihabitans maritimus]